MSARDKLLGRETLWEGFSFFGPEFFGGPKLPPPWFYVAWFYFGIGLGAAFGWWFL